MEYNNGVYKLTEEEREAYGNKCIELIELIKLLDDTELVKAYTWLYMSHKKSSCRQPRKLEAGAAPK